MNTTDIKTELQKMIEQENDIHILEAIKTLLQKASLNPLLKKRISSQALQSEEGIKENSLWSRQEKQLKLSSINGLGAEIWKGIDIDKYIENERQWE